MTRSRADLPGGDFFFHGFFTRTIFRLFTVSQPVSSSLNYSSNKIVICEVLPYVTWKIICGISKQNIQMRYDSELKG